MQWLGDATFGNAEFDLIFALGTAVGVTLEDIQSSAFAQRFGPNIAQITMVAILAGRLVATDRHEPALVLLDLDFRSRLYAAERSARANAGSRGGHSSQCLCNDKIVCRLAGKPFFVNDFN